MVKITSFFNFFLIFFNFFLETMNPPRGCGERGYDCFLVSAGNCNPGVDSGLSSIPPVNALVVLCDHRKVVYFVLFSLKLWLCSPQVLTHDYHPFLLIVLCDHRKVVFFVLFSLKLWLSSPQVLTLDYHPFLLIVLCDHHRKVVYLNILV